MRWRLELNSSWAGEISHGSDVGVFQSAKSVASFSSLARCLKRNDVVSTIAGRHSRGSDDDFVIVDPHCGSEQRTRILEVLKLTVLENKAMLQGQSTQRARSVPAHPVSHHDSGTIEVSNFRAGVL